MTNTDALFMRFMTIRMLRKVKKKLKFAKMGYTTTEKVQLVIWNFEKGKSVREICEMLKVKRSTVYNILKRYKQENRIDLNHSPGRPKRFSTHEERAIVRKVKADPLLSAPKIVSEVMQEWNKKVGSETVRRVLRKAGLNGRVARKKPFVSKVNKKKRLQFARQYSVKPPEYWEDVIFADESKYNVFASDGRRMVWREPNTALKPRNLKPTVKHGNGSCMVWGCISAKGVGELVFIDSILNKERYLELLKSALLQSAEKLGIRATFKYWEDNDPKHKARLIQEWQLYNCPKVLHPPPQSPDLNPIEHLWDELDRRVHQTPIRSKTELQQRLRAEWSQIPSDYLRKIIMNMPRRLQCVKEAQGNPTKY